MTQEQALTFWTQLLQHSFPKCSGWRVQPASTAQRITATTTTKNPSQTHQCLAQDVMSPSWDAHSLNFLVHRRVVGRIQTPASGRDAATLSSTMALAKMAIFAWSSLDEKGWASSDNSLMDLTALLSNCWTSVHPLWLLNLQLQPSRVGPFSIYATVFDLWV